jgi:hypothetical protein
MRLSTDILFTFLLYLIFSVPDVSALSVKSIEECPPLSPRDSPATHIRDLRVDDIDVRDALIAYFSHLLSIASGHHGHRRLTDGGPKLTNPPYASGRRSTLRSQETRVPWWGFHQWCRWRRYIGRLDDVEIQSFLVRLISRQRVNDLLLWSNLSSWVEICAIWARDYRTQCCTEWSLDDVAEYVQSAKVFG